MNAAQALIAPWIEAAARTGGAKRFTQGTPPKRRRPFKAQLEWRIQFGRIALDNKVRLR